MDHGDSYKHLLIACITAVVLAANPAKGQSSTCMYGTALATLETSQQRLTLGNVSGMRGEPGMETTDGMSRTWYSVINLWVAGKVDGEIRESFDIWSPRSFIPGPTRDTADCAVHDIIEADLLSADWTVHDGRAATPLGLDVHIDVRTYVDPGPLGRTTVWTNRIVYKGAESADSLFIGVFTDLNMSDFESEATGSDTLLSMAYIYPRREREEKTSRAITLLEAIGPDNERRDVHSIMTYSGDDTPIGASSSPGAIYKQLRGFFQDGAPLVVGGEGHPAYATTNVRTLFSLPGDPAQRAFWSVLNADGFGGELSGVVRPFSISAGPFKVQTGDALSFSYAMVWSRGASHLDSITQLRRDVVEIRNLLGFPISTASNTIGEFESKSTISNAWPNPANDAVMFTMLFQGSPLL